MANKTALSERDVCTKFVTPALTDAGWDLRHQIREEVTLTKGRIKVRGRMVSRGKAKRADYVLYYKPNLPLAVIEAKDETHSVGAGMQQALAYAEMLDVPFAFSTNGRAFLFHDRTGQSPEVEREIPLSAFPSPEELWRRYCAWKGIEGEAERIAAQDYYLDGSGKTPRYYQLVAINRVVEAIARGQRRILLVMATGTGKTYTAFQIIWRLWKARRVRRVLFLADRNILVDQTRINDFKPFGNAMTKITNRTVDKSYEIYLALYQAVSGSEEEKNIYKQFSPDFFDLVVVDECHRGSAAEDSAWREILEYFAPAIHLGLTATPKETRDVSNIEYFGEPVYVYSLKQGIEDGFLAPYKVVRIDLDKDLIGWRPEKGQRDKYGREIEDRIYNQRDFDRSLVLEERTKVVARKITEFLKATDRYAKTIVFCEDIDHAERMRQALVNENADLVAENPRYVVRITGDNEEGKAELDHFIDPESRYPVIATTSRLLTTGVDAQTCKVIVLDRRIESMTEFKQIIGRGTRVNEEYGKYYFTILDFKKATELFADPQFDGDPVKIYVRRQDEPVVFEDEERGGQVLVDGAGEEWVDEDDAGDIVFGPDDVVYGPDHDYGPEDGEGPRRRRVRYVVDNVPVFVVAERVQYYGPDGKLITESLRDYTRRRVTARYATLDDFLQRWTAAERKEAILRELEEQGVLLDALAEEVGRDYDPFDLVCHVAFDRPPLTRRERAKRVRKRDYFARYGEKARAVLEALLDKYADEGIETIESVEVLRVRPLSELGTPVELIRSFGSKEEYLEAVRELERALYAAA